MTLPKHNTARIADIVRNLIYPAIPVIVVISIWTLGYAASLESKVKQGLAPLKDRAMFQVPPKTAPQAVMVTSVDHG